jgi:hypothetical protein
VKKIYSITYAVHGSHVLQVEGVGRRVLQVPTAPQNEESTPADEAWEDQSLLWREWKYWTWYQITILVVFWSLAALSLLSCCFGIYIFREKVKLLQAEFCKEL